MKNAWLAARERLERFPLSIVQLAMRIGVGSMFFTAGLLKYNSWEFTVKRLTRGPGALSLDYLIERSLMTDP